MSLQASLHCGRNARVAIFGELGPTDGCHWQKTLMAERV